MYSRRTWNEAGRWSSALLGVLLFAFGTGVASGQSIWLDGQPSRSISVEILKPNFDDAFGGSNTTFWTSVLIFAGRYPVGETAVVTADLPVSHFGVDSRISDGRETVVGNPYFGVEFGRRTGTRVVGQFGIRPAWGEDSFSGLWGAATRAGLFVEFTERFDAFASSITTLSGAVNYYHESGEGFGLRFRGRPAILFVEDDQNEFWITYSVQGWYETRRVRAGAGLSGLFVAITEGSPDFGERIAHQVGLAAIGLSEQAQPGVELRIPVDQNLREVLDLTFGLSVTVPLR